MTMRPFHPIIGSTVKIAATAASGAAALTKVPSGSFSWRLFNEGPNTVFLTRGPDVTTLTAALTDYPLPAGCVEVVTVQNTEKSPVAAFAAICKATETAALYATIGDDGI